MKTLSRFQRNALMRAACAGAGSSVLNVIVGNSRRTLYSNTGVAPFGVISNAFDTTDTETIAPATTPYLHDGFIWNTGEITGPGVAIWGGNCPEPTRTRNLKYGPIVGGVYEVPGTYWRGTLVKSALTKTMSAVIEQFIVTDPNAVYAGNKTICFSNDADFTGAPIGCIQVTTSLLSDIQTYVASNKRLRGKRGATFTASASTNCLDLSAVTGATLDVFGSGTSKATASWSYASPSFASVIFLGNDCRLMDWAVQADAGNTTSRGISCLGSGATMAAETVGFATILRCTGDTLANFILPNGTGTCIQDVSCTNMIGGSGNVAVYNIADGQKNFYMGGFDIDRSNTGEHVLRFQGFDGAHFEAGRVRRAASSKVLMACRGIGQGAAGYGTEISRRINITNVKFDRVGSVGVTACLQIQAQSTGAYEPIQDVIVDHCEFTACDAVGAVGDFPDILVQASNVMIRHNMMNHSSVVGTNNAHTGVSLFGPNIASPTPSPGCQNVIIKNNTCYGSTAVRMSFIQQRSGSGDVLPIIQTQNVVYAPLAPANVPGNFGAGQVVTVNAGGAAVTSTNSTFDTGASGTTEVKNLNPLFITTPTTYLTFGLQAGSYGIAGGSLGGSSGYPWGIDYNPAAI